MFRKRKRDTGTGDAQDAVAVALDALYAELPRLKCKGKCWQSCGPILMSPGERARIASARGVEIPSPDQMAADGCATCPALKRHKCSVYEVRPMVCRLWGIDESAPCPLGCEPEGGWLTREEAVALTLRVYQVAGWPPGVPKLSPRQIAELLRTGRSGGVVIAESGHGKARKRPR